MNRQQLGLLLFLLLLMGVGGYQSRQHQQPAPQTQPVANVQPSQAAQYKQCVDRANQIANAAIASYTDEFIAEVKKEVGLTHDLFANFKITPGDDADVTTKAYWQRQAEDQRQRDINFCAQDFPNH